jgi:hypothetical protein
MPVSPMPRSGRHTQTKQSSTCDPCKYMPPFHISEFCFETVSVDLVCHEFSEVQSPTRVRLVNLDPSLEPPSFQTSRTLRSSSLRKRRMDFASPHLSDEHLPSSFNPRLPSASSSSSTASTRPFAAPSVLYTPPSRSHTPAKRAVTTEKENEDDFERMLRALRTGEGEGDKGRMAEVRSGTGSVVESKPTPSLGLGVSALCFFAQTD